MSGLLRDIAVLDALLWGAECPGNDAEFASCSSVVPKPGPG